MVNLFVELFIGVKHIPHNNSQVNITPLDSKYLVLSPSGLDMLEYHWWSHTIQFATFSSDHQEPPFYPSYFGMAMEGSSASSVNSFLPPEKFKGPLGASVSDCY